MWYRNLFIKITYMYSSLLKRRLQRVGLRITTAPRSRRREAAGSARGPDPAPGRATPARPSGGSMAGERELIGSQGSHVPPARPGQATAGWGEDRNPAGARISWWLPASGRVAGDLPSDGRKSRPGVCWRNSSPRPSLLPTPGPASQPGSRPRSRYRAEENPSREPSFRRATVRTGRLFNTSPALLKTPDPCISFRRKASRGYMGGVLPLICLQ